MFKSEKPFWWPEPQALLAIIMVCSMVALAFVLVFKQAPDSDIFKMLIGGFMTTGFATIINFYFGSSKGSATKDETISKITTSQTVIPPTHPAP